MLANYKNPHLSSPIEPTVAPAFFQTCTTFCGRGVAGSAILRCERELRAQIPPT